MQSREKPTLRQSLDSPHGVEQLQVVLPYLPFFSASAASPIFDCQRRFVARHSRWKKTPKNGYQPGKANVKPRAEKGVLFFILISALHEHFWTFFTFTILERQKWQIGNGRCCPTPLCCDNFRETPFVDKGNLPTCLNLVQWMKARPEFPFPMYCTVQNHWVRQPRKRGLSDPPLETSGIWQDFQDQSKWEALSFRVALSS